VCAARLERGRFSWPQAVDQGTKLSISAEELALLLGGIDLASTRRKQWWRREDEKERFFVTKLSPISGRH
jgi:hypothetical protein